MMRKQTNKAYWFPVCKTFCGGQEGLLTVMNNAKMILNSVYLGWFISSTD